MRMHHSVDMISSPRALHMREAKASRHAKVFSGMADIMLSRGAGGYTMPLEPLAA